MLKVKFCLLLVNDPPLYLNVPAKKSFEENFLHYVLLILKSAAGDFTEKIAFHYSTKITGLKNVVKGCQAKLSFIMVALAYFTQIVLT